MRAACGVKAKRNHHRRPQASSGALKDSLRRWWDPNQEIPGEGRTEYDGVLKRVGRCGGAPALCDASSGDLNGAQVRREESRGGRSQRGRGESPVRGGRREPWLDRGADDGLAGEG